MSGGNYMFMMITSGELDSPKIDTPIYEAECKPRYPNPASCSHLHCAHACVLRETLFVFVCSVINTQRRDDNSHLNQFIIHAALDMVDDAVWGTSSMFFKNIDKFNEYLISSFVTAGHVKMMLLHDVRNEDGIRNFFHDVHELYVKVLMNPFYQAGTPITSATFDSRVKLLGRRYF